jgi:hypothetical protein
MELIGWCKWSNQREPTLAGQGHVSVRPSGPYDTAECSKLATPPSNAIDPTTGLASGKITRPSCVHMLDRSNMGLAIVTPASSSSPSIRPCGHRWANTLPASCSGRILGAASRDRSPGHYFTTAASIGHWCLSMLCPLKAHLGRKLFYRWGGGQCYF